eukprot:6425065-Lingulodinium_polyedra.AAC.1
MFRQEIRDAEAALAEATTATRRRRGQRWYEWVQEAIAGGAGRLYRWIKVGAPPAPASVPDPAAGPDVGGAQALATGSREWLAACRGGPAAQFRLLGALEA